ncbi:MAG: acyclic terpene utilization AtuA family protein [Sedimentitalea sp.]
MISRNQDGVDVIRIANCSGFYGDKLSAAREMVEGGSIDVLTGDYLAELTMSILHGQRQKKAGAGYVATFLKQLREVVATCLDRNIKIVTNAGGLNPKGMAQEVEAIVAELGLTARVAFIEGDDVLPRIAELSAAGENFTNIDTGVALRDTNHPAVTANACLGAWGITEALTRGADIVICPRVTDAAVVIGPAAWKFGWARDDYDALAGALAAGHIIECGAQATGGNYAFFQDVPSFHNIGYPIAEIERDGSFTITKHPGTGGLVSTGTVTAQLLYEISTPAYLNPDVISHFDALKIDQSGVDRVRISRCRGSAPPKSHKVCINTAGGYRNSMELLLTGLDIEEKAKVFCDALFASVGGRHVFEHVSEHLIRSDKTDPATNEEAFASLKIDVKGRDPKTVGRIFSAKIIELALANYPGFCARTGVGGGGPFVVHWPALVDSKHITERVTMNGKATHVLPTSQLGLKVIQHQKLRVAIPLVPLGRRAVIPFGRLFGTRSGDKGGCANLGVWAKTDEAYGFLHDFLTVDRLKTLIAETADLKVERYELANIKALNFFIHGILEEGASSSTRIDGQAKSLGEYLRAKLIEAPKAIITQIEIREAS